MEVDEAAGDAASPSRRFGLAGRLSETPFSEARVYRSATAGALQKRLAAKWRPRIKTRDGVRCRGCGAQERLDLAHITPIQEFEQVPGHTAEALIENSFRDDNLLILCRWCHSACDTTTGQQKDPDSRVAPLEAAMEEAGEDAIVRRVQGLERIALDLLFETMDSIVEHRDGVSTPLPAQWRGPQKTLIKDAQKLFEHKIAELRRTSPYQAYEAAKNRWFEAFELVTNERRERVKVVVTEIEAKRGWRTAAEFMASLAPNR